MHRARFPNTGQHPYVDLGYSPEVAQRQLRHSDTKTTLGYIHLRGDVTEEAELPCLLM
jgi:hypothetical protein